MLFSRILGRFVPYTGSIAPRIQELEAGYAVVAMADSRKVRNHLNSIHAIALVNLAEVTSGLALVVGLPPGARAILTGFSIRYLKKARGTITGECRLVVPQQVTDRFEEKVKVALRNSEREVVAEAEALWTIGPELER